MNNHIKKLKFLIDKIPIYDWKYNTPKNFVTTLPSGKSVVVYSNGVVTVGHYSYDLEDGGSTYRRIKQSTIEHHNLLEEANLVAAIEELE